MARKVVLSCAASIAALAMGSVPAVAQTADSAAPQDQSSDQVSEEEIVVTGLRASLGSAQQRKQQSLAVIDSIVAEDIGKFPDNTVSDALQRVTGIQVQRGAGEAGTVLIRGLPNVQSHINGREVFTGTGRGFALQDIPAELVAGVDVYKSPLPEQVGGAIAGLIDVRMRKPFDFDGLEVAGSARGVYGEQVDKLSYVASGLVSNRWDVGDGEIGVLLAASFNKRHYRDDTAFNFISFPTDTFDPRNGLLDSETGLPVLIPDTVGSIARVGNRERPALNASIQYRPNPDLEFWVDGTFTGYREKFDVNFFVGLPRATGAPVSARSATGNGQVVSRTYPGSGPIDVTFAKTLNSVDNFTITSKQAFQNKTDNYQFSGGTKWTTGPATFSTELTYDKSTVLTRSVIVDTAFNAPVFNVDFDNGGTPVIDIQGVDITDPANFSIITLFDNNTKATSEQIAWRGDLLYAFDGGPIENFKLGVRYARRKAQSFATNPSPIPIPGVPVTNFADFGTLSPGDVLDGKVGLGSFFLADSGWLRENIDVLRGLAGRPAGDPAFDLSQQFSDVEKSYDFYGQAQYRFDLGGVDISGLIGGRLVNTVATLSGFNAQLAPASARQNYVDVLPNFSLKAQLTDELVLRFAAGKSISKPDFAQLNPAVSLFTAGNTGGVNRGNGGNPNLQPIRSKNLDATLEWYFAPSSLFAVSAFYRDVSGFINNVTTPETFGGETFFITRPQNSSSGTIKGLEANLQTFFDFLPGALSGFGVQLNGTYLDGVQEDPTTGEDIPFPTVSKYSYNVVAMYEKYGFSARLAYNWRSKFTDSFQSGDQPSPVRVKPLGFLDFSASYDVTPNVTVTIDATNLLDTEYQDRFEDGEASIPRDTRQYDRTFGAGVRFRF